VNGEQEVVMTQSTGTIDRSAAPTHRCFSPESARFAPSLEAGVRTVEIPAGKSRLKGTLAWPCHPSGFVVLVRGRGGERSNFQSARLGFALRADGLGTLLLDHPTDLPVHGREDRVRELLDATEWLARQPEASGLPLGYLGIRSGATVALLAAAESARVGAVVVCGPPSMSGERLAGVRAPTLLVVAEPDHEYFRLRFPGSERLGGSRWVTALPGGDPRWESTATLAAAGRYAAQWFVRYLILEPAWRSR
jgi:putative phosphoribosyl transferase